MPQRRLASDEELLADLKRIAALAPSMNTGDIERHGKYNRMTYINRIGNLDEMRRRIGWVAPEAGPDYHALKARLAVITDWTEEECISLFRRFRWPGEITCPRCGDPGAIARIKNQRLTNPEIALYECIDCRYQFSDISGTVFHRSCTRMKEWFLIIATLIGAPNLSIIQQAQLAGINHYNYRYKIERLRGSKMVRELAELLLHPTPLTYQEPSP